MSNFNEESVNPSIQFIKLVMETMLTENMATFISDFSVPIW